MMVSQWIKGQPKAHKRGIPMRRIHGFLVASVASLTLGLASGASAADMPVYLKAPPIPVYNYWTGFYLGGGGSDSWGRVKDTGTYNPGFAYDNRNNLVLFPAASTTRPIDHGLRGMDGEIQGGYRTQLGTFVLGVEGVARLTDQSGTGNCGETYPGGYPTVGGAAAFPTTVNGTFSCYKGTRLNSTEALLFQGGVLATPQLLLQVSGGPALGQVSTTDAFTFTYGDGKATSGSSSQTADKLGYWVGGGAEYAIPNTKLHLKLEYYHMGFGNISTTTSWTDTTGDCIIASRAASCNHSFTNDRKVTDDSVMIGINYMLN
jgi:hypothetical protein